MNSTYPNRYKRSGFTIVELLVVIVIIGILASITIVAYTGISARATAASLQSDLTNAKQQLAMFQIDNGSYPATISTNCTTNPDTITNKCLKPSSGNVLYYNINTSVSPATFGLTAVNSGSNVSYRSTSDSTPIPCPIGFIIVPGSTTYGTSDFCVMKYEARQVGSSNVPISQASGTPWVNVSQTAAIANSPNVVGCSGCHLITNSEWMTIAQNVLKVPSNWDNGAGVHNVGTGYIYSGHNDNVPSNAVTASTDDTDGYYLTGNVSPSSQRRTLTLTNGEVIWDMSGNVYEWTSGQTSGGQPGVVGNNYSAWIEWNAVTTPGSLPFNPTASGTGITGASSWTSANGIGELASSTTDASLRALIRSGAWGHSGAAGVLFLEMDYPPSSANNDDGFRVTR